MITTLLLVLIFIVPISGLRRRHSAEIYLIWYSFSLSALIFGYLHYLSLTSGVELAAVFGPDRVSAFNKGYEILTSLEDELYLVIACLALAIVPQMLAYAFSMWSGSATSPRFVRTAGNLAVISVVKFLAVWSAVIIARPLAQLFLSLPVNLNDIHQAMLTLAMSFCLAYAWNEYLDKELYFSILPTFNVSIRVPAISKMLSTLHDWATRHSEKENGPVSFREQMTQKAFDLACEGAFGKEKAKLERPEEEWIIDLGFIIFVSHGRLAIYVRNLVRNKDRKQSSQTEPR